MLKSIIIIASISCATLYAAEADEAEISGDALALKELDRLCDSDDSEPVPGVLYDFEPGTPKDFDNFIELERCSIGTGKKYSFDFQIDTTSQVLACRPLGIYMKYNIRHTTANDQDGMLNDAKQYKNNIDPIDIKRFHIALAKRLRCCCKVYRKKMWEKNSGAMLNGMWIGIGMSAMVVGAWKTIGWLRNKAA